MQFVQLEGHQTPNYFDFYRQRLPAAFQHPRTEGEAKEPDWLTPAHKEAFKSFDAEMAAVSKNKKHLPLLQTLLKYKSSIVELPEKAKKDNFTLSRFVLYLLPVIQLAFKEKDSERPTKEFVAELVDLIRQSESGLATKINILLYMFNGTSHGMKATVFRAMVQLCQEEGQLEILIQKARNVVAESASWQLTGDERKSLYLSVAESLDKANDEHAFAILHAYLRLFELDKTNAMPAEKHARRCVILAIKSGSVINFEELLSLKTIKALEEVSLTRTNPCAFRKTKTCSGFCRSSRRLTSKISRSSWAPSRP